MRVTIQAIPLIVLDCSGVHLTHTLGVHRKHPKNHKFFVILENIQIEIINNKTIVKTWYRNITANFRHFTINMVTYL